MDLFYTLFDTALRLFPENLRDEVRILFGVAVVVLLLLALAKFLRLFEWRRLPPPTQGVPQPGSAPGPARAPPPPSREQVLSNVATGKIDRATAEWLFAQLPKPLAVEAMRETHDAFVDTVETMGAAPRPGERDALLALAKGDSTGALDILNSQIGVPNPEQLRTFAAIAAPADPQRAVEMFSRFVSATVSRPILASEDQVTLSFSSPQFPGVTIGLVTGNISKIKDVDAWVNSENDWLTMARMIDRSISANIRYLSSNRGDDGVPRNDPIQSALKPRAYGRIKPMELGSIRITGSGALRGSHGVKRILHVISVKAKPLDNVVLGPNPGDYVRDVMRAAEAFNRWPFRGESSKLKSMVVPMFGTGMAGEKPDAVTDVLVDGLLRGAAAIMASGRKPALKEVRLLAFSTREYLPLRRSFEKRVATGDLVAVTPA